MRRLLVLGAVAALAILPVTAGASDSVLDLGVTAVDTSGHPEVVVRVSAPRHVAGEPVPAEAFALTEAGQPRDATVEKLRGDELEVVLALDTSGSMGADAMAAAKGAAAGILEQLPDGTRISVVEFNSEARVASALSSDVAAHRAAIGRLEAAGETALYDGIAVSLEQFSSTGTQRAVVVLSDGGDTSSASTLHDITGTVAGAGATLHAIELSTEATEPEVLEALATAGAGGRHIAVTGPEGLAEVYGAIASELRDSYVLTYRSQAQGRVELRVTVDHEGTQAQASRRVSMPSPPVVPFAPGVMSSPWTLAVGALLMFAAFSLLLLSVLWPGEVRSILSRRRSRADAGPSTIPGMTSLANQATLVVERTLQQRGWTPSLNASLERAGLVLRPGEFVLLAVCAAATAFAVGLLLSGLLLSLALSSFVGVVAVFGLKALGERRRAKFADQLGETLQLTSGSLRAGYSLLQAVDAVAREADSPTAEEYRRLVVETRLGRELDDALAAMDRRIGTEDFEWVVQAITIHREVGGDLAEVLDTVARTIRERNQIRRQVKALSAEGKLSAIVLYVLPFGVAGFVALTNPSYLSVLVTEPIGWAMLATAGVLLTVGGLWLRKVVRITF